MAEYGPGFAGGMAQGMQNAMSVFRQNEMIQLEQKRLSMQTWGHFAELANQWKTNPAFARSATVSMLQGMGLDPQKGQGKNILDMFDKAETDELTNIGHMATEAGLAGVDPRILQRLPMSQWGDMFKQIQTNKSQQMQSIAAQAFPVGGEQEQPQTTPVTAGQPQPVSATGSPPMGGNGAASGAGGGTGGAPNAPQASAAPSATLMGGTPAPRTIVIGGKSIPLAQGQGGMAAKAADIYDAYLKRADLLEQQGGPVGAQAAKELRDKAMGLKDNANITLTPAQASSLGFKPGAVVQYNLASGQIVVPQAGQDTYRTATPDELNKLGFKPGTVVSINKQTNQPAVIQQGQDTFRVIPTELNGPLGLDQHTTYQQNIQTHQITPVAGYQNEPALAAETAKADVKKLTDLRSAAETSIPQAKLAKFMQTMNSFGGAGIATEPELIAGRVADALGLESDAAALKTGSQEAMEGAFTKLATDIAKNLSSRNVSGKELGYLTKAGPAIFRTKLGNQILTDIIQQSADTTTGLHDLAEQHLKEPGVKQLSDRDASGKNFYDKETDFLRSRSALTDKTEQLIDQSIADISAKDKVRGVTNPISQMGMDELKILNANKSKLSPMQLQMAADRWDELTKAQQGAQP